MKLACSSSSYDRAFQEKRLDLEQWLRICGEELELDGVELSDRHLPAEDLDYLREIKRACIDLQLTISCVSVASDFGLASAEARAQEVANVKGWVDNASYLGAPVVRVSTGRLAPELEQGAQGGGVLGGVRRFLGVEVDPKESHRPHVIEALRECADYGAQRGIVLGVENENGRGFVASLEEIERCLDDVGSRWLRLTLNTGGYGDLESLRRALVHAVHVHAKLYDLDEDGADERLDWPAIVHTLRQGSYRGFLSIEYQGEEDSVTAVPRGVRFLRAQLSG